MVKTHRIRGVIAFGISILFHVLLLVFILNLNFFESEKKIDIDDFVILHEDGNPSQKIVPKIKTKPKNAKVLVNAKKIEVKRETKEKQSPNTEPLPKNNTDAKLIEKSNPLVSFLTQQPLIKESKKEIEHPSNISLYSQDFETLSLAQQKFLLDNLDIIQIITQNNLQYPYLAQRFNLGGRNIVEFKLHPDGSISDLKLLASSTIEVLDKNSLDTILISYKDYPYPKETTVIRFYITYINY